MKKILHFVEKLFGIYRWHPTIALRYLPFVTEIQKAGIKENDILEVGSSGLGIVPYIKRPVVGVDVDFSFPIHPQLIAVKASATTIPFVNNSFPVIVSTDMIEHLSEPDRIKAISEMLRVGKDLVLIGVPSGSAAQKQDADLSQKYTQAHKKEFAFFAEHATHGLPEKDWLFVTIEREAKKLNKPIKIKNFATLNLGVRKLLMYGWISDNLLINILFRKVLLIFIPLLRRCNQPPCYREHFVVTIMHD